MVWNSVTSTFNAPSNRRDAVSEEITCAIRRFRLVYVGRSMSRDLRQMSYTASLSNITETSVCSSSACVDNTELYGSTTAVETAAMGKS